MAEKSKLLDVWIVEGQTVYREVPFSVVADWLQQGRLLGEDRVRASGSGKWFEIQRVPAFSPYVPRAEPLAVQDTAEALEPIDLGLESPRRIEAEDDDVDMIPLIDVSLVLLIFFMLTATVSSGVMSPIKTPGAREQLQELAKGMYWLGIDKADPTKIVEPGPDGKPLPYYSFGKETEELQKPTTEKAKVFAALTQEFDKLQKDVKLRIRAHEDLPIEIVRGAGIEVRSIENGLNKDRGANRLKIELLGEVSEPQHK